MSGLKCKKSGFYEPPLKLAAYMWSCITVKLDIIKWSCACFVCLLSSW